MDFFPNKFNMTTFWKKSGKSPKKVVNLPQTKLDFFFFQILPHFLKAKSIKSKKTNCYQLHAKKPTRLFSRMISRMLAERAVLTELMSSSTPFLHAAGYVRDCSVKQRPYAAKLFNVRKQQSIYFFCFGVFF